MDTGLALATLVGGCAGFVIFIMYLVLTERDQ